MKVFFFIIIVAFSVIGMTIWRNQMQGTGKEIISPIVGEVIHEAQGAIETVLHLGQPKENLTELTEQSFSDSPYEYGIVVKNLKTGEMYQMNQDEVLASASLYKLWVMATVFDEIQNGTLAEHDVLTQDVTVLNEKFNIATEAAELTEGTVMMTVGEALERMITVSDNYAALLLSERVRNSTIQRFLTEHGFTKSKLGQPPTTTAGETALFLEKLYNGDLADDTYTRQMLTLLKNQTLNNKIPRSLPDDVIIAHKTGELGEVTHDAGIVYDKGGDYILVVLSQGNNQAKQEDAIAAYAKTVYDYFSSRRR